MIRNADAMQESAFTVTKPDGFVPAHHPLWAIRVPMNKAPTAMNRWSSAILAGSGRDALAPENPGRALSTGWHHVGTGKTHETTHAITPVEQARSHAASGRLHVGGEFRQPTSAIAIHIFLPGHPRIDEYHLRAIFVGARRCAT